MTTQRPFRVLDEFRAGALDDWFRDARVLPVPRRWNAVRVETDGRAVYQETDAPQKHPSLKLADEKPGAG